MKSPRLRADPKTFASDGFRFGAGTLAAGLLLIAAVFAAHFPAIHAGYIWDDDAFLYQNPIIMAPDGLYRFWFTTEASDYWPLTHTMFWLEWRIWGDNPMPYHVGNIILHAVAVLLLWRVFARLGLDEIGAYLAAMIFAVHPVTVESVAWISERKNVLSLSLYLLSILAYFRFEDRGSRRWYVLALLAAAAALLAKVSVMTLPVVLLLCAWWRRGSLTGRDILRTLPFFAMSLAMGLLEIWFVGQQASISGEVPRPEGFLSRIAASGWIVWFYLYKTLLPLNLSMVYPRWNVDGGNILSFVPLALLIGCFVVLWRRRTGWGRAPLAALGYFVITLGPVLGFMDMSFALYSLVADHLQYPAMPGIVALAGGWLGIAVRRVRQGSSRLATGGVVAPIGGMVVLLGALTWRQARVYESGISLWTHVIGLNDKAWVAYCNRGLAYTHLGHYDPAIRDYTKTIELKPDDHLAYNNRGNVYAAVGQRDLAIRDYTKAIESKPDYADACYNRGNTHRAAGAHDLAIRDYTRAIKLKPDFEQAYANRGLAYRAIRDHGPAIRDYTRAIELNPDSEQYYNNRGNAYGDIGDSSRAIRDYTRATVLNPTFAEAYLNRAAAHYALKRYDRAWADLKMYRQLGGTPNPELVGALIKATGRTE